MQRDSCVVPQAVEDLWDRHGVSTEYLELCKTREQNASLNLLAAAGPPLPVPVRDFALRSMMFIVGMKRMSIRSWFQAVLLLDTQVLQAPGSIEMLPATCVCLLRLLRKVDCSETDEDSSTWLSFAQHIAQSLAVPGFQVPEVTQEVLSRHEMIIGRELDWQLDPMALEQWISMFSARLKLQSSDDYGNRLQLAENKALNFARLLVMHEARSLASSRFELALGLFFLSLVGAQLIPLGTLCPQEVFHPGMHAVYVEIVFAGTIPVCVLTAEQVRALLDNLHAATCSDPDMLQQATHGVMQTLGNALRDMQQRQHANIAQVQRQQI
eukprot:TRINITY_DN44724_c0_g1_i1.p1 TRINITY_DN44724_c0_g1~~TRINITY_DN44724_c0_g1_i1.p1  ORF type:complete len:325 (+),score=64.32 TRINITY_DN44724_c0_g1_i1:96-1070(+)